MGQPLAPFLSSSCTADWCSSSAAQILPAIQPAVKHVKIFIRSPLWLLPDISTDQGQFTLEEIETFVKDPAATMKLRKSNESTMNSIFSYGTAKHKQRGEADRVQAFTFEALPYKHNAKPCFNLR
jgi:cation diffusion facilitator CzcD-associated flavoprotein CzcO